jgi:hypothetical protein
VNNVILRNVSDEGSLDLFQKPFQKPYSSFLAFARDSSALGLRMAERVMRSTIIITMTITIATDNFFFKPLIWLG